MILIGGATHHFWAQAILKIDQAKISMSKQLSRHSLSFMRSTLGCLMLRLRTTKIGSTQSRDRAQVVSSESLRARLSREGVDPMMELSTSEDGNASWLMSWRNVLFVVLCISPTSFLPSIAHLSKQSSQRRSHTCHRCEDLFTPGDGMVVKQHQVSTLSLRFGMPRGTSNISHGVGNEP